MIRQALERLIKSQKFWFYIYIYIYRERERERERERDQYGNPKKNSTIKIKYQINLLEHSYCHKIFPYNR